MKKIEFDVLRYLFEKENTNIDISDLSENIDCGLDDTKKVIFSLQEKGLVDEFYNLTKEGIDSLEPYKVKNAIILAAGMSSRFVPVSYELPKGLISVKGDVMIERIIRQLQEAGITEIVLVVGYMMEKFFYLRNKYNVKLVVNNEYATKNTHSSIYASRDFLSNTYICCSDNYYPKNMFHQYEYRAFYCSIYLPGVSYVERAFSFDDNNLIYDTNKPSKDQWIMYGHAYYDREFSEKFKPILESYYGRPGIEYMYWETIYAENVKQLPMYIEKCKDTDILEFDSMEELKLFDKDFIRHNKVKVFENICQVLHCDIGDITDIEAVKKGLNNRSFKFKVNGSNYIYRHPGENASNVIDRKKEAKALRMAKKLKIDETLIYIDEEEGWKISRFVEVTEEFDFSKKEHIQLLSNHLKTLHTSNVKVGFGFDYIKEADKLIEYEKYVDALAYRSLIEIRKNMKPIFDFLEKDKWQVSLCHNDIYEPNLLISENELALIDWEFAGDADIGFDICKLFAVYNPKYEEIDDWLFTYYNRKTTEKEKIHLLACAAVIYYYWYVWAVYASKNSEKISEYIMIWYDKMNSFGEFVISKLKGD